MTDLSPNMCNVAPGVSPDGIFAGLCFLALIVTFFVGLYLDFRKDFGIYEKRLPKKRRRLSDLTEEDTKVETIKEETEENVEDVEKDTTESTRDNTKEDTKGTETKETEKEETEKKVYVDDMLFTDFRDGEPFNTKDIPRIPQAPKAPRSIPPPPQPQQPQRPPSSPVYRLPARLPSFAPQPPSPRGEISIPEKDWARQRKRNPPFSLEQLYGLDD